MSELPATREYEHAPWSETDPLCARLKARADAMHDELLARIAELEAENKRFWAAIGSVAEHDRVFGAHIAAAMKEFDLHARTEEGSE